jgi:hypothetical protein
MNSKTNGEQVWQSVGTKCFEEDQTMLEAIDLQEHNGMFQNYFGLREAPFGGA